jgi:hypothetical protein
MIKAVVWSEVLRFVAIWAFVLIVCESATIAAAIYGVGAEQRVIHGAMCLGFLAGVGLCYWIICLPLRRNLAIADDLIKSTGKILERCFNALQEKDLNDKTDPDWWKNDKGRDN